MSLCVYVTGLPKLLHVKDAPKNRHAPGLQSPFWSKNGPAADCVCTAGEVDGGVAAPAGRAVLYSVTRADRSSGNVYIYKERENRQKCERLLFFRWQTKAARIRRSAEGPGV